VNYWLRYNEDARRLALNTGHSTQFIILHLHTRCRLSNWQVRTRWLGI